MKLDFFKLKVNDLIKSHRDNIYVITNISTFSRCIKVDRWRIKGEDRSLPNNTLISYHNLRYFKMFKNNLTNNHPNTTLFK